MAVAMGMVGIYYWYYCHSVVSWVGTIVACQFVSYSGVYTGILALSHIWWGYITRGCLYNPFSVFRDGVSREKQLYNSKTVYCKPLLFSDTKS